MFLSHITPCGECCEGCPKKSDGLCEGCRETGGRCAEWTDSGICPTYACCQAHNAVFCGMCPEFPCNHLPMRKWRPDCVRELRILAHKYNDRYGTTRDQIVNCTAMTNPDHEMQRIKHNAVCRAICQLDTNAHISDSLSFIETAVASSNGINIIGADCARKSAQLYDDDLRTGQPEYGAFVFYDCNGVIDGETYGWGHCGLCIGEGKVIHAWDHVRIDHYLDIEQLMPVPHWTTPKYLGWVPLERVLAQKP